MLTFIENYIIFSTLGTSEKLDSITLTPLLIQKGTTQVAIYGLGSMRDERLNRLLNQGKEGVLIKNFFLFFLYIIVLKKEFFLFILLLISFLFFL